MVDLFEEMAKLRSGSSKSDDIFEKVASSRKKPQEVKKQEPVSLKGAASAYSTGFGGGAGGIFGDVLPLMGVGGMLAKENIPAIKTTPERTHGLEEQFGLQPPSNALERILQQGGEFGGMETTLGAATGGLVGAGAGAIHGTASGLLYGGLKELGMDDTWALGVTALATVSPIAFQRLWPKIVEKFKSGSTFDEAMKTFEKEIPPGEAGIPPPPPGSRETTAEALPKSSVEETFPSGLTKSKAVEHPHASKALLTEEQQAKRLASIDQEASKLAREKLEKHVPHVKKIEEGFDFDTHFEEGFKFLKKSARKFNPDIDLTDVSDYLKKSRKSLGSFGKELMMDEQIKILKEIKYLTNHPQTELKKLLDLFRLNNKKRSKIYENRFLSGKQKDYTDFLTGLNKAIAKSFERTFPEDSVWLNKFKSFNQDYSNYMSAQKSLNLLENVLKGDASPALINKLAVNPKMHKRLELAMGKEGADEIIQLAKDIKRAKESIKNIPVKKLKEMHAIYPLGLVIPGIKIPAAIGMTKMAVEYGRRAFGWYLTSPKKIASLDEAVRALIAGDVAAYKEATKGLSPPTSG